MKVEGIKASIIKDTRGDKTIEVTLKTNDGIFKASSPNGKSKGLYEAKSYKESIEKDIEFVNKFPLYDIQLKKFEDLKILENIFIRNVGANTMIAIEYVFLKAISNFEDKQVWELINPRAKKMPMPIGNVIGGGAHSQGKKPDFQEFHFIPFTDFNSAKKINKIALEELKTILKKKDRSFKEKRNDENAWQTSLNNEQIIEILKNLKGKMMSRFKIKIALGIDVAASSFYKNEKYMLKNPKGSKTRKEQIDYFNKLSRDFYYLEDALEENDFLGFKKLTKNNRLIVGDDLTVTNLSRIKNNKNSINAVIIKPNQIGSLIEVSKIVNYCKKNNIKTIFSHRSGETSENILADLAFGFQADFIKTGVVGKGRSEKLNRLIQIEKSL